MSYSPKADYKKYLLMCLSEEAGEIVQAVGKIQRTEIDNYDGEGKNLKKLEEEFNDLLAIAEELGLKRNEEMVANKKERIKKFVYPYIPIN